MNGRRHRTSLQIPTRPRQQPGARPQRNGSGRARDWSSRHPMKVMAGARVHRLLRKVPQPRVGVAVESPGATSRSPDPVPRPVARRPYATIESSFCVSRPFDPSKPTAASHSLAGLELSAAGDRGRHQCLRHHQRRAPPLLGCKRSGGARLSKLQNHPRLCDDGALRVSGHHGEPAAGD